jgi:thiol:disulfide interchange protein
MRSRVAFPIVLLTLLLGAAAASAQTVTGEIEGGTLKRGKRAKAVVTLDIPSELHVNSNKPKDAYLIPTTITAAARGLRLSRVKFPDAHDRKFAFSEKALNVFEGRVQFTFDVTVPKGYRGKKVIVDVSVRYQACTEEVCYPPKTKQIQLEAAVQ